MSQNPPNQNPNPMNNNNSNLNNKTPVPRASIARIDPDTVNRVYGQYINVDVPIDGSAIQSLRITNEAMAIAVSLFRSIEQGEAKASVTPYTAKESFTPLVSHVLDVAIVNIQNTMAEMRSRLSIAIKKNDAKEIEEVISTAFNKANLYELAISNAIENVEGFLNLKQPSKILAPIDTARVLGHFFLEPPR